MLGLEIEFSNIASIRYVFSKHKYIPGNPILTLPKKKKKKMSPKEILKWTFIYFMYSLTLHKVTYRVKYDGNVEIFRNLITLILTKTKGNVKD